MQTMQVMSCIIAPVTASSLADLERSCPSREASFRFSPSTVRSSLSIVGANVSGN